ncbi:hypothetical protein B4U79_13059 [Dinothrombium tinctorium]|uniref:Chromodomain-helicase-DNA-binding protein 1-like C-terminal domain-containing protein n=1 Tax=Dinothrombium tinctorium TaxID=1965070 RepID=A0A3S3PQI3_9ACAR|nr:hypothetical protein B4U79_13059 [Dinothrombium tinctorium]
MRPVKKWLKQLGNPDASLSDSEQLKLMKECLLKIGQRIKECLDEYKDDIDKSKEWRNHLWTFVSKFTEFSPKKLYKLYKHALKRQEEGTESDSHRHHRRRRRSPHKHEKYSSDEPPPNPMKTHNSTFKRPSSGNDALNKRPRDDYGRVPPIPQGPFDTLPHPSNYMYPQPPPIPPPGRIPPPPWNRNEREAHFEMNERGDRYRPYPRPGDNSPEKKFRDDRQRFRNNRPPNCFPPSQPKMPPTQYVQWPNYSGNQMGPSPSSNVPISSHQMPHMNYHHYNNSRDPRDNRFDWGTNRPDNFYRNTFNTEDKTSR